MSFTKVVTYNIRIPEQVSKHRKWNYLNIKLNYFTYLEASDQNISFIKVVTYNLRIPEQVSKTGNSIIKQEMELFKQEMELFHPFRGL